MAAVHHLRRPPCTTGNGTNAPSSAERVHHGAGIIAPWPAECLHHQAGVRSHPLVISRKQLKERTADIYLRMYHYTHRDVCPRTHRVYHDMLYDYVLQQIRQFAKSMKKRKVNAPIAKYSTLLELTPEVLSDVIERIEIGHVTNKSKPGKVIQIYWKLC